MTFQDLLQARERDAVLASEAAASELSALTTVVTEQIPASINGFLIEVARRAITPPTVTLWGEPRKARKFSPMRRDVVGTIVGWPVTTTATGEAHAGVLLLTAGGLWVHARYASSPTTIPGGLTKPHGRPTTAELERPFRPVPAPATTPMMQDVLVATWQEASGYPKPDFAAFYDDLLVRTFLGT